MVPPFIDCSQRITLPTCPESVNTVELPVALAQTFATVAGLIAPPTAAVVTIKVATLLFIEPQAPVATHLNLLPLCARVGVKVRDGVVVAGT